MEWEFDDDGRRRVTDEALGQIRFKLGKGDIDGAVELLREAGAAMAEALLRDLEQDSRPMRVSFGRMFFLADDPVRAAKCAERGGDWALAAKAYQRAGQPDEAARCAARGDADPKLFEREEPVAKPRQVSRAGGFIREAVRSWKKGDAEAARAVLESIPESDAEWLGGSLLLAELDLGEGLVREALSRLTRALARKAHAENAIEAEAAYNLANGLARASLPQQAVKAIEFVLGFDPAYKDAFQKLLDLSGARSSAPEPAATPATSDWSTKLSTPPARAASAARAPAPWELAQAAAQATPGELLPAPGMSAPGPRPSRGPASRPESKAMREPRPESRPSAPSVSVVPKPAQAPMPIALGVPILSKPELKLPELNIPIPRPPWMPEPVREPLRTPAPAPIVLEPIEDTHSLELEPLEISSEPQHEPLDLAVDLEDLDRVIQLEPVETFLAGEASGPIDILEPTEWPGVQKPPSEPPRKDLAVSAHDGPERSPSEPLRIDTPKMEVPRSEAPRGETPASARRSDPDSQDASRPRASAFDRLSSHLDRLSSITRTLETRRPSADPGRPPIDLLRRSPAFRELTDLQMERVAALAERKSLPDGSSIGGDGSAGLWIASDGGFSLGAGLVPSIGELSLVEAVSVSGAERRGSGDVWLVPRAKFLELAELEPRLGFVVARTLLRVMLDAK